ncbi:MAG TPA: hypothetical protein VMF06_14875 [Candidatus Limnocylindria bacterium]|nr:hypothetical protein [Candidatus Limnocylindria bacterium]
MNYRLDWILYVSSVVFDCEQALKKAGTRYSVEMKSTANPTWDH